MRPRQPRRRFEGHRNRFYLAARIGRDVPLIGVGIIGTFTTPPSVEHFVDGASFVAMVWAWMFIWGTVVSLAGILLERPIAEIGGASLMAGGFTIWTIAALGQPVVLPATWQIALVFISCIFGLLYRIWMIANDRVRR